MPIFRPAQVPYRQPGALAKRLCSSRRQINRRGRLPPAREGPGASPGSCLGGTREESPTAHSVRTTDNTDARRHHSGLRRPITAAHHDATAPHGRPSRPPLTEAPPLTAAPHGGPAPPCPAAHSRRRDRYPAVIDSPTGHSQRGVTCVLRVRPGEAVEG